MSERAITDPWERGSPYERYMGRWSRRLAPQFVDWLALPAHSTWVDVGCGTGALAAAIVERSEPREVIGVEPSDGFLTLAAANLRGRATLRRGTATALPLDDASADAIVSALVLNFVPDPAAGLREMRRVARPGGTVAACVWDYADGMAFIRRFWDAAVALDPGAAALDEGARFPLCRPGALRTAFEDAGYARVETTSLTIATRFASFDDYWQPFLGGQGPAPGYAASLDEPRRAALREALRQSLPILGDGAIELDARAWAVRGTRAD